MPDPYELIVDSDSVESTRALGRRLGVSADPGTVVALVGPLGAGKTQLAKGVAVGLGVQDERRVTSPTFVIVREHPGRLWMYHVDAYRVSSPELVAIGFDEMCASGGVVVVEWADRVDDILPEDHLSVRLEPTGSASRRLVVSAWGERSRRLLERLDA